MDLNVEPKELDASDRKALKVLVVGDTLKATKRSSCTLQTICVRVTAKSSGSSQFLAKRHPP
jgi:hypothetical protein